MTTGPCISCGHEAVRDIFSIESVPIVCNQLEADVSAARRAPAGPIALGVCEACGLVFNRAFEPERMAYAPAYENALHHSPRFRDFADRLAGQLVERYGLQGGTVVEVGCGDGDMLRRLLDQGVSRAVGFDPAMEGRTGTIADTPGLEIVPDYFDAARLEGDIDLILCRHVLEHLDDPVGLLTAIRRQIGDRDVPVYFEVPNGAWMLRSVSIWDVIYEHVSYFTAPAIETAFRRAGFAPVEIRTDYGDQFLMVEARPAQPKPGFLPGHRGDVIADAMRFGAAATAEIDGWRTRLSALDGKAVLWGAGSKGISFANALGDSGKAIVAMVDLNPRKHGLMTPGTAVPVVAPDALPELAPDLVLIANALYAEEIRGDVGKMGLHPAFDVIAG